jgi:2-C-methyl-D-erythritol 4-phosphate cytidylyltransferase
MGRVWAVVVAGGSGERYGERKQFALLAGRRVVEWSVEAARSVAEKVVVVVPADATTDSYGADFVVAGGPTRSASVRAGLAVLGPDVDVVVVHDAARPLATPALFKAVVDALDADTAGAICAVAVTETIKAVEGVGPARRVRATVDRSALVSVQTPQAFVASVLREAHGEGAEATDDAALVESLGATVRAVEGDPRNLKLTTPLDLAIAEQLLRP